MCGRFVMLSAEEVRDIAAAIAAGESSGPLRSDIVRQQAFPGSTVSTIGLAGNSACGGSGSLAIGASLAVNVRLWGFATSWGNGPVFNTRIESALSGSPLWRDAFQDGRCIIPAAVFFEPHRTEKAASPKTGKPVKRPYMFGDEDGLPLLMAGVSSGEFCSVVTCDPNDQVSPVHPRMPLVLRFREVETWLQGNASDVAALADRSSFRLSCQPELPEAPDASGGQLSLF